MPLGVPRPPEPAVQALRDGLAVLNQRGEFTSRALRKVPADELGASVPHAMYNLGLSSARGGALGDARLTGWRFLLTAGRDVVASAETRLDGGGTRDAPQHAFAQVTDGPFARGTLDAVAAADDAAAGRPERYELRMLHVPALYLMAVWLHADPATGDESDLFVPVAPAPAGLEPNRVYTSGELRRELSRLAAGIPDAEADERRGG